MNKTETKLVRAEIRDLKASLNKAQKSSSRQIAGHRKLIRAGEREITTIERNSALYEKTVNDRLAILDGRLNS